MAGTVIVPWYATGFRADGFEQALNELLAIVEDRGSHLDKQRPEVTRLVMELLAGA